MIRPPGYRPARQDLGGPAGSSVEQLRKPRLEALVGQVDAQRRHGYAVLPQRLQVGSVGRRRSRTAREGDPVIRVPAAVVARIDAQPFLVAFALGRDLDVL